MLGLPSLSRRDFVVLAAVGVLTALVDSRVEVVLVSFFYQAQGVVKIFDFTGGAVNSDLLISWEEYGAVLAIYLVRKPGSGTLALTVNGFGQFLIDGLRGPHHLLYGVAGLGADLVFAASRYRRYDAATAAIAGVACQVFWIPVTYTYHEVLLLYPVGFVANDIATRIVGGAVGDGLLGAVLGWVVLRAGRRLARSGRAEGSAPELPEGRDQLAEHFLGIAEDHHRIG